MSNKTNISNKINIGFAFLIVFLLIFATNRIDKIHFETVQNALTTVYKDRVVAQDYVHKMNTVVYKIRLHFVNGNGIHVNQNLNREFQTLLDAFGSTKLTLTEAKTFESLKDNFLKLKLKEQTLTKKEIENHLDLLQADLRGLAVIQVSESKYLTDIAQKSLDNNRLISQLEIWFLILVGFLVQFIIFYRTKKVKDE